MYWPTAFTSTVSFVEVLLDSLSILISPGTAKSKHCLYWTVTAHENAMLRQLSSARQWHVKALFAREAYCNILPRTQDPVPTRSVLQRYPPCLQSRDRPVISCGNGSALWLCLEDLASAITSPWHGLDTVREEYPGMAEYNCRKFGLPSFHCDNFGVVRSSRSLQ